MEELAIVTERAAMKGAMEEQDDGLKTISYSKNISKTPNIIAQPKRRLKKKRKVKAKKKYSRMMPRQRQQQRQTVFTHTTNMSWLRWSEDGISFCTKFK